MARFFFGGGLNLYHNAPISATLSLDVAYSENSDSVDETTIFWEVSGTGFDKVLILRSFDGVFWSYLAESINNNSSYVDTAPSGNNYYRVRGIDTSNERTADSLIVANMASLSWQHGDNNVFQSRYTSSGGSSNGRDLELFSGGQATGTQYKVSNITSNAVDTITLRIKSMQTSPRLVKLASVQNLNAGSAVGGFVVDASSYHSHSVDFTGNSGQASTYKVAFMNDGSFSPINQLNTPSGDWYKVTSIWIQS